MGNTLTTILWIIVHQQSVVVAVGDNIAFACQCYMYMYSCSINCKLCDVIHNYKVVCSHLWMEYALVCFGRI